jgi:uncharacterized protein YukJ
MPLTNPYGVWVAHPLVFTSERTGKSPHGNLVFDDGSTQYKELSSAINVKSTSKDSRLVYWSSANYSNAILDRLQSLDLGFHDVSGSEQGPNGIALDFLRGGLVDLFQGQILTTSVPGPDNDIVDHLTDFFSAAIKAKATVYLWGEQYEPTPNGIHDIHMNQGNTGRASWTKENGIWQDGSILLKYPDGHWEATFLAFAAQATKTDDGGQPDGETFAQLLNDPDTQEGQKDETESHRKRRHGRHHTKLEDFASFAASPSLQISGATVTPSGQPDKVSLQGATDSKVSPAGWLIVNQDGKSVKLGEETQLGRHGDVSVEVPDKLLSKDGGTISLADVAGRIHSHIVYSKIADKKGEHGPVSFSCSH